jgi:hypothetical protein
MPDEVKTPDVTTPEEVKPVVSPTEVKPEEPATV